MEKSQFSSFFKQLREEKGLSQPALANELGVSNGTVNFLELGKRKPGKKVLTKLSDYLNVELSYLEEMVDGPQNLNSQVESKAETTTTEQHGNIEQLNALLQRAEQVDISAMDDLVTSFMRQTREYLISLTDTYRLSDLRLKFQETLSFNNEIEDEHSVEGYLMSIEENQLFFKFIRSKDTLTLILLQSDESNVKLIEEWVGPYVYNNPCDINVPHLAETQKGVSFTWFSPYITMGQQYSNILQQDEINIEFIQFNSDQLAWYVQNQPELTAVGSTI